MHGLDFERLVMLVRADTVTNFGDGYRQVSSTEPLQSGEAAEMLNLLRAMPPAEQARHFIFNEGGNYYALEEVERQLSGV